MKIAIIDDEQAQRELLQKYVKEWGRERSVSVVTDSFAGSEEFLFHWEEDASFDLLILDVEMGRMSGVELAEKLREKKESAGIIFVTGFEQYMAAGYDVDALHYLLKPVQKEKLFRVLDKSLEKSPPEEKQIFRAESGMISLPVSAILYFEAQGHHCALYTKDGCQSVYAGISELKEQFAKGKQFASCHRSYLVNLKFVAAIEQKEVILDNGVRLPLSRSMGKTFQKAFLEYYGNASTKHCRRGTGGTE